MSNLGIINGGECLDADFFNFIGAYNSPYLRSFFCLGFTACTGSGRCSCRIPERYSVPQ